MSQNITAVVDRDKATTTAPKENIPKPCVPSQVLDATINKEAFLELPALPQTSYSVTSIQEFAATFDANVLKVLSKS